jgi:hypothetical protein
MGVFLFGTVLGLFRHYGTSALTPQSARTADFFGLDRFNNGAGEGIRTLDPDLGKVVLYP